MQRALYDELEKSGFDEIMRRHSDQLRYIISRDTIPRIDGHLSDDIDEDIVRVRESGGEKISAEFRIQFSELAIVESIRGGKSGDKDVRPPDHPSRIARALKWANCGVMIAGGTGLAAGNIILGVVAGGALSVATLGIATVIGAYLGLLTSGYTGIVKVGGGLKTAADLL